LVPGLIGGSALMRRPSLFRSLRACGLRKITLFVPEDFVEGIRQFARELSTR
jgi:hypothetical protein